MTTAVERLETLLDAKDAEIFNLRMKLEKLEDQADSSRWKWLQHTEYEPGTEPNPDLPVPRLEIRWTSVKDETAAIYSLVYRHLCGQVVFAPLGMTRTSASLNLLVNRNGSISTPFRDGAHFTNEMCQLGLRGFVICGDSVHETKLCSKCQRSDEAHSNWRCGLDSACTMPPRAP